VEWLSDTITEVHHDHGTYSTHFADGLTEEVQAAQVLDPAMAFMAAAPPVQGCPTTAGPVMTPPPEQASTPIRADPSLDPSCLAATGARVEVGMAVESMFSNGEWYPATITAVHPDGRYGVLFEDGFEDEDGVSGAQVRPSAGAVGGDGWNHDVSGGLGTPPPPPQSVGAVGAAAPTTAAGRQGSAHPRSLAATGRLLARDEDHRVEALFARSGSTYYHIWTYNPRFYSLYRLSLRGMGSGMRLPWYQSMTMGASR